MTDLKTLALESLAWIKKQAPSMEAELYVSRGEDRGLELRDGRLDGISGSFSEGAGLRLLCGARMGFACAGGLSPQAIQGLFHKVSAQLPYLEEDAAKGFPAPSPSAAGSKALEESLMDPALFTASWEEVLPKLKEMEASALAVDRRLGSVLRAGYGESRGEAVIANTLGVVTSEHGGSCSVGLSTLCEEEGESQVGSAFQSSRKASELDFKTVGRQAGERTVSLLGAKKLPSGRRAVLFDPWVAGELLDLVSSLLCADQVQRGKSLLAGKLGQKVGSSLLTFIDDPRRLGGLASSVYDDEGVPTASKTMIEKGVVKEYFYDHYTASREKRADNGCAGRGGFKGLPSPGSSNFYLAPGALSRAQLLADTQDGILVHDIMGMHMADPISGEFSVGVSGLAVRGGEITHPVKNAMVSGNLIELLGRVDAVACDLTFYGGTGAPTFRVADMTVA